MCPTFSAATPTFIDTHVHLDSERYGDAIVDVLARSRAAGIAAFISIGASNGFLSAEAAISLAEQHTDIWASVGIHPHDASVPLDIDRLATLAQHPRVVAIGESGMDLFYDFAPKDLQAEWFIAQIDLAKRCKKPLVIHCRNAAPEILAILKEHKAAEVGGVFHCFSEEYAVAKELLDLNFSISVGGILTFKKAQALRDTFRQIPLSQILLETDGPFLAPEPFRGKTCESAHLPITAKCLAEVKGLSLEEVSEATTANAQALFRFSLTS